MPLEERIQAEKIKENNISDVRKGVLNEEIVN